MTMAEFETLWTELSPPIFYRLTQTTGDDALDILQNLAVNTLRKLDNIVFEGKGAFFSWLSIAAEYERRKFYREKNKVPSIHIDDKSVGEPPDDLNLASLVESNIIIYEIYHQLRLKEQTLFELRLIKHLPYSEIAEITGKREEAIMTAVSRLRKKLQNILKNIGYKV